MCSRSELQITVRAKENERLPSTDFFLEFSPQSAVISLAHADATIPTETYVG